MALDCAMEHTEAAGARAVLFAPALPPEAGKPQVLAGDGRPLLTGYAEVPRSGQGAEPRCR